MECTLALLAFDSLEESPFRDLFHMMQRQKVWSEVNQAVLDYENRGKEPETSHLKPAKTILSGNCEWYYCRRRLRASEMNLSH
ncbi:hypothetical protein GW7_18303 [Heterocephalus glaber]|uniref:CTLH/CRA C-terminal to LisH motif domain-containing protein n=1 Tax=Heterocephalus glaber TaxID=10181 RepID=G5BMT3_HETGA|nr:hypothetical protein GW7_18303 [Heterocephalus glaber]